MHGDQIKASHCQSRLTYNVSASSAHPVKKAASGVGHMISAPGTVITIQREPVSAVSSDINFPMKGRRGVKDWARYSEDKLFIPKEVFTLSSEGELLSLWWKPWEDVPKILSMYVSVRDMRTQNDHSWNHSSCFGKPPPSVSIAMTENIFIYICVRIFVIHVFLFILLIFYLKFINTHLFCRCHTNHKPLQTSCLTRERGYCVGCRCWSLRLLTCWNHQSIGHFRNAGREFDISSQMQALSHAICWLASFGCSLYFREDEYSTVCILKNDFG